MQDVSYYACNPTNGRKGPFAVFPCRKPSPRERSVAGEPVSFYPTNREALAETARLNAALAREQFPQYTKLVG